MDRREPHSPGVNLDAYCRRIGHEGPRTPTLATLAELQRCHVSAITFEAIDVLLGLPVDIGAAAVDAKLIDARRGGYCFEQNSLFKRALEAIGFQVEGLLGRVHWMRAPEAGTPARSHMALRVWIEGEAWLVDAGFGSCVPTAPLRLADPLAQRLSHDTYRIVHHPLGFRLDLLIGDGWSPVYDMPLDLPADIDYVVANWFTSTHPSALFRRDLMVARTVHDARFTLLRNQMTVRTTGGDVRKEQLSASSLLDALHDVFQLPVAPAWLPMARAMAEVPSP